MTERMRGRKLQERRHLMRLIDPLCERCRRQGRYRPWTQLDHRIPLNAAGGKGEDSPDNLQRLCDKCHALKTREDMGQRPKLTIGVDGYPIEDDSDG